MSHFTVLVIGGNQEDQLQPFHEYECTGIRDEYVVFVEDDNYDEDEETGKKGRWTNPNRKWDWYSLGGRWAGFFTLKPNREGIQGHHRAKDFAKINGEVIEDLPLTVADLARKKDIDFERMRDEAGLKAQNDYEKAMTVLGHLPVNKSWNEILKAYPDNVQLARNEYWSQPRCKATQQSSMHEGPDEYLVSKEEYIENARNESAVTFAVIKDGKWYERGRMGWWGSVSDEKDNWNEEFKKLIDSVPDDEILSVYDCHI